MEPVQDTNCENTYGDEPDESGKIECVGCGKALVITIVGGVWTDNMNAFECEECFY